MQARRHVHVDVLYRPWLCRMEALEGPVWLPLPAVGPPVCGTWPTLRAGRNRHDVLTTQGAVLRRLKTAGPAQSWSTSRFLRGTLVAVLVWWS